jgi:hypothetical protein
MRKALIAVAVATALFAVGAFAASFTTVQSEDVASGNNAVTACAEYADVDFDTTYIPAQNDWNVTGATVTFYANATGTTIATLCDGFDATLIVENELGVQISDGIDEVASGVAQVDLDDVAVGLVGHASVLVDGQTLIVDPTPTP